jgi:predicted MFS family arabinose efflux permease
MLGKMIDTLGEKVVLAGEAAVLLVVCLLYGFAGALFPPGLAFVVVAACFVADQLLMSVGMARATYLKKIATHPSHVTPALTASTSIDHVFSISTALVSGIIWQAWGYQFVFLLGACIAVVNLVSTLKIRMNRGASTNTVGE